ncbi:hypothetical protein PHLGIDRAFT_123485 [Phlebiopsis gigantea 11061_1 CR5-6]|uniref:Peptidase S9 prolyl oligopeptidase catalytic domain-containing protein n=1 Tax=Phlebiopsis gigantea (strain 11061_1 CR5-6) TaxID=745531 RepID=A0A0C3NA12_PHLG1|nr:hypothetical protein PHLGIDRAFT_123485 [Phlebiopsis gigantea 11061_1 CR5-6]
MTLLSRRTVFLAGLPVHVFSTKDLGDISGKVAVLFLLHGRQGSAREINKRAESIVRHVADRGPSIVTLLVVTIDQRNHGERLYDALANNAWNEGNDRHAIDMYAMYTGTSKDISYLIDLLPSYLFPSAEAEIVQWSIAGVSLGGHAAWFSLCAEPRITLGVPIIGCPDYLHLISRRAQASGIAFEPPYAPQSFVAHVQQHDPPSTPFTATDASNPFYNKKVLVLSGADDPLVPWESSDAFVRDLHVGPAGVKQVVVYPGVGHACTEEMVKATADFVWEHVLTIA